jgi:RNA polymerase sigma-70 factor, ECF subfamily
MITFNRPSGTSAEEAAHDSKLVERFKKGDESAFAEIMERYRGRTYSIAFRSLHNHADAEEITQDTFIRAHRALANFRGDSSLATWLNRIAVNLSRNRYWYFFRRHRHATLSLDSSVREQDSGTISDLIAAETADPAQESSRTEFSTLVSACMEKLNASQREILKMRAVQNLPYEEIAETLQVSTGTVKSRLARTRENLRKLLAEMCPEFSSAKSGADYFLALRPNQGHIGMAETASA